MNFQFFYFIKVLQSVKKYGKNYQTKMNSFVISVLRMRINKTALSFCRVEIPSHIFLVTFRFKILGNEPGETRFVFVDLLEQKILTSISIHNTIKFFLMFITYNIILKFSILLYNISAFISCFYQTFIRYYVNWISNFFHYYLPVLLLISST